MILLVCSTARRSSLFLAGCLRLAAALNPPTHKLISRPPRQQSNSNQLLGSQLRPQLLDLLDCCLGLPRSFWLLGLGSIQPPFHCRVCFILLISLSFHQNNSTIRSHSISASFHSHSSPFIELAPFGLSALVFSSLRSSAAAAALNPQSEKRAKPKKTQLKLRVLRAPLKLISFHQIAQFFHNLLSFINFISRLGPQTAQQTSFGGIRLS